MTDLGGESACWAHLVDDLETGDASQHPTLVDVADIDGGGSGAMWSLPHGGDLDANLVRLDEHGEILEHVNDEVDVFIVVSDGIGEATIDDHSVPLRSGVAVLVPRGARRAIRAGADGIRYFSIHRRRDGLTIRQR